MSAAHVVTLAIPARHRERSLQQLRTIRDRLRNWSRAYAVNNRVFSSFYFGFLNRNFLREAVAVTAGQLRYERDHRSELSSYYLLRRNIHRLEKGLIMRPRRLAFAAEYIGETVAIFSVALKYKGLSTDQNNEILWAIDVLRSYFSVVDRTSPAIASAYRIFQNAIGQTEPNRVPVSIPYVRDLAALPPVGFDAFMQLCRRRRSVRWYLDRPVSRELIDQAVLAAGQAPSACNRQPFYFRIFDDKDAARKVAAIPGGTKGFAEHLPAVAVLVGRLRAYPQDRDRHAIYVDGALAAMTFMFALETMGMATCSINWPDQEPHESRMREALSLEQDERVVMLIALGWPDPDGMVPFSAKRGLDELRMFN